MGKPCAVPNCNKKSRILQLKRSIFKVPTNEILRKEWQSVIPNLRENQFVCDRHFDESYIIRRYVKHGTNGEIIADVPYQKARLMTTAVPSIFFAEDGFEKSLYKECPPNNEPPVESDLLQKQRTPIKVIADNNMIDATVVPINPLRQQQKSTVAIRKAIQVKHAAVIELKQLDSQITTKLIIGRTNNECKMEKNNTSVLEESYQKEKTDETVKKSVDLIINNQSDTVIQPKFMNTKKTSQALKSTGKFRVSFAANISDENDVVTLPTTWNTSQKNVQLGTQIVFFQMRMSMDIETKNLIIERYIVIESWSGRIHYYVYGKEVNAVEGSLPTILTDVSTVPAILAKFERMRLCRGLESMNTFFMKDEAFQDSSDSWHHKECSLVVKKNNCESCQKLRKTIWQRQRRCKNRTTTKILSKNVDYRTKVKILTKKLQTERRLRNRARSRVNVLKCRLQLKQDEMANLTMESIEEKCRKFKVSDQQTLTIKEIFAAAKTSKKGRRYSEDWFMQCMLMNARSPSYYRYLQENDIIPLPCSRSIRRLLSYRR